MSTTEAESLSACKRTGVRSDVNGDCPRCGGDACIVRFYREGWSFGMLMYGAHFLEHPAFGERQVTREQYCEAERKAGFRPKPGCGPEATGSFGAADGMRGRHVQTWPERVA